MVPSCARPHLPASMRRRTEKEAWPTHRRGASQGYRVEVGEEEEDLVEDGADVTGLERVVRDPVLQRFLHERREDAVHHHHLFLLVPVQVE